MYRILASQIKKKVNKVKVLLGPRQIGKTTLLKNTFRDAFYINTEEQDYIDVLNSRNIQKIKDLIKENGNKKTLILDEVQRLDDPGLIAKVVFDNLKNINLIISGSSSLEIAYKASESLAGRKITYKLFALTFSEYLIQKQIIKKSTKKPLNFIKLNKESNTFESEIKNLMRYGLYPEIMNCEINMKEKMLYEIVDSVILKDIYYLNLVRNTKNLLALLKLLAYQIGSQVNYSDIASRIGISRQTVMDYIEILKQTFIIYTLSPFRKNRRDEIGKTEKIYFYDLGIRNALIEDFSPTEYRNDFGNIFENFAINEIMKLNSYYNLGYGLYYWRTKWGSEVDLVLNKNNKQIAIEIKTRQQKMTKVFQETYPDSKCYILTLNNIANILL